MNLYIFVTQIRQLNLFERFLNYAYIWNERHSDNSIDTISLINTSCNGVIRRSAAENLRGTVSLDGSSTVFLISEVIAEEFNAVHPNIHLNVTLSHRSVIFLQQSANGTM